MDDLAQLWQAHCAMAVPAGRNGRQVRQLFMHSNDLRLRWLANAAPDLAARGLKGVSHG